MMAIPSSFSPLRPHLIRHDMNTIDAEIRAALKSVADGLGAHA